MNDRQRAKHNRNLAVRTVCNKDANRALWSSLPAFTLLFDRLQAKTSLVNACALIQGSDRTGVAEAKNDARAKMSASTLEVGGAVSTYGFLTGNADLQAQASLNPTDLARLADAEVDDRATAILQLGQRVPAASPGPGQPSATDVGLNPRQARPARNAHRNLQPPARHPARRPRRKKRRHRQPPAGPRRH